MVTRGREFPNSKTAGRNASEPTRSLVNELETKLYQPFERVESPLKIKTPGTGLGLYLTHKILSQLLGGSITVQSELGQGTAFTIIIPINKSANDALTVASDADPNVEAAVL